MVATRVPLSAVGRLFMC
uniref:Uncharacterized protein n=1 Tax=Arundo donax TaxID=35708 RepID=A0A0A8YHM9_ARUDO